MDLLNSFPHIKNWLWNSTLAYCTCWCYCLLSTAFTALDFSSLNREESWSVLTFKNRFSSKILGSRQLFNWCCSNSNTCAMLLVPTPYVYPNNMNKFCIKMSEHVKTLLCIFLRCVITLSQMFKPRESHKSTQGNGAFQCTHTAHACSVFSCHSTYTPENVQVHFHILSW